MNSFFMQAKMTLQIVEQGFNTGRPQSESELDFPIGDAYDHLLAGCRELIENALCDLRCTTSLLGLRWARTCLRHPRF